MHLGSGYRGGALGATGVPQRQSDQSGRHCHTFSQPDLIIAATAQQHGLMVVSHDTSEFLKARVPVFSPWTDSLPALERREGEGKDGNL
jgi:hypothetical protein